MEWRRVSEAEAAETAKRFQQHRRNDELLRREWQKLVDSHLGQWVIAYGGDTVVAVSRPEDIRPAIPREHMGSAVVRTSLRMIWRSSFDSRLVCVQEQWRKTRALCNAATSRSLRVSISWR